MRVILTLLFIEVLFSCENRDCCDNPLFLPWITIVNDEGESILGETDQYPLQFSDILIKEESTTNLREVPFHFTSLDNGQNVIIIDKNAEGEGVETFYISYQNKYVSDTIEWYVIDSKDGLITDYIRLNGVKVISLDQISITK